MCSGRETIKCPGCGDDIIPEQVIFISVQNQEALAIIINKSRQEIMFIQRIAKYIGWRFVRNIYSNLLLSSDT